MKHALNEIGEPCIWQNQMTGEYKTFKSNTYRRMVDLYIPKWYTQVNDYSGANYGILKNEFFFKYLTGFSSCKLKYDFCKFHTGYSRTNIYDSYSLNNAWLMCNENINADEFHYLFECKSFENLRKNGYQSPSAKVGIYLRQANCSN